MHRIGSAYAMLWSRRRTPRIFSMLEASLSWGSSLIFALLLASSNGLLPALAGAASPLSSLLSLLSSPPLAGIFEATSGALRWPGTYRAGTPPFSAVVPFPVAVQVLQVFPCQGELSKPSCLTFHAPGCKSFVNCSNFLPGSHPTNCCQLDRHAIACQGMRSNPNCKPQT